MPLGWCDRCKKTILYDSTDDGPHLCGLCKEEWEEFHMAHAKEIEEDKMKATTKVNEKRETKEIDDAPVEVQAPDAPILFIGPDGPHYASYTIQIPIDSKLAEEIFHPAHYIGGRKYEPAKVAYDWGLDFNLGSALKYISRAGRKDGNPVEKDLVKAIAFIIKELEAIQEHKQ